MPSLLIFSTINTSTPIFKRYNALQSIQATPRALPASNLCRLRNFSLFLFSPAFSDRFFRLAVWSQKLRRLPVLLWVLRYSSLENNHSSLYGTDKVKQIKKIDEIANLKSSRANHKKNVPKQKTTDFIYSRPRSMTTSALKQISGDR